MARALSRIIFRGVSEPSIYYRSSVGVGSFNRERGRYSTVTGDSDTHEDFQPTRKLEGGNISVKDIVEQDIKENPVMIYMKGIPDAPRCGFSALAVRVLKEYSVPFGARNILEDQVLKDSVKAVSAWPTFPQIFIKGEFIGGSDIILNMHQSGELKEKFMGITPPPATE
ncbi:glutaredoxin 4 [Wolffia australiana]